ncbi:MAG: hypothetical protein LBF68_06295, partial [Christensenellaceae bacterium]|nr:hypothetical protein [Christensenellaceae bacterium]
KKETILEFKNLCGELQSKVNYLIHSKAQEMTLEAIEIIYKDFKLKLDSIIHKSLLKSLNIKCKSTK